MDNAVRNEENDDFGMCTNDVVLFLKHACGVEGCVRLRENVYRAECAEFTQVASVPTSLVADTSGNSLQSTFRPCSDVRARNSITASP